MNERNKPTSETLNAMRDEAYSHAVAAGFHADGHTQDHYFCLVITELMEAVEADRKDRRCTFNLDQIYDVEDDAAFYTIFQAKIKDTVEDELADTAIRLLDYAGYVGTKIDTLGSKVYTERPFTDMAYAVANILFSIDDVPIDTVITVAIGALFQWADRLDFDLTKHIEMKMRYNRNRPRLHGKKY